MSEIRSRLPDAARVAMCAQDKLRLTTSRLTLVDIKRVEVDECVEVDGARALLTLDRMIKQRRDAQCQFSDASCQDLTEAEAAEVFAFQDFTPKPLDDHKIDALIERSIVDSGVRGPQDMGKAMNLLRPQTQGRVDMARISQCLKVRLSS